MIAAPAIINDSTSSNPENQNNPIALIISVLTALMFLSVICMISITIIIIKLRRHRNDCNKEAMGNHIESIERSIMKPLYTCLLASVLVCPFFLASTLSPLRVLVVDRVEIMRIRENRLLDSESVGQTHTLDHQVTYGTLATFHEQ